MGPNIFWEFLKILKKLRILSGLDNHFTMQLIANLIKLFSRLFCGLQAPTSWLDKPAEIREGFIFKNGNFPSKFSDIFSHFNIKTCSSPNLAKSYVLLKVKSKLWRSEFGFGLSHITVLNTTIKAHFKVKLSLFKHN